MQFCGNLPLLYLRADTHHCTSCALLRERDMDKEAEEAQKLELIRSMREKGMTLNEIAESLGYKDHSAVSKLLKRNSN